MPFFLSFLLSIIGSIVGSGVSHRYAGAATGLTNLGFNPPSAKVLICGPTGCGKTTLISIIAGLEDRYQGAVSVDGYNRQNARDGQLLRVR